MSALSNKWVVILNPTSGNGKSIKKWPEIKRHLDSNQFDYELAFTEYHKHSVTLIKDYIDKGVRHVICIGGDGTLHNIVNGIMTQSIVSSKDIFVGMIPIGTGNDWVKTHRIPMDYTAAISIILKGTIVQQDIGKIMFKNQTISPIYFNNLAGVGFDGYVVSKINKKKHFGAIAYLVGALLGLFTFKNFSPTIIINNERYYGKTLMVLVGLCQYSGGGMQLTKTPNPFDGYFDVSIAKDFSKFDVIKNLGTLFNGSIVHHDKVVSLKTKSLEIIIDEKDSPYIQSDGELIGTGSINLSIIPNAFSFYCKHKKSANTY